MTIVRCAAGLAAIVTAMLVQATLVGPLVYPVPVSVPLILVVGVAVLSGPSTGIALGFGAGLLADLNSHHPVGVLALTWLGAGVVAGVLGGIVMAPGRITPSGRITSGRITSGRITPSGRITSGRITSSGRSTAQGRATASGLRRPGRWSKRRRTATPVQTSRWRAQGLLTGLVAAGATGVSLTLTSVLGDDARALPAALLLLIPAGLIDAMVAVAVVGIARVMLSSAALRPVTSVRLGGAGSAGSAGGAGAADAAARLPMDVSMETR